MCEIDGEVRDLGEVPRNCCGEWTRAVAVGRRGDGSLRQVALRESFDRAGSGSQVPRQNHLTVIGWIDVVRSDSSSTSHRGRSSEVRTPSRRGAMLSMENRTGKEPECRRVGASTERPAGQPPSSRQTVRAPRVRRRCRSPSCRRAGRRRAVAAAHRRSRYANASTIAASAGREPRVWCSGIPRSAGPSAGTPCGRGSRARSCAPAPALSGRELPRVVGSDAYGVAGGDGARRRVTAGDARCHARPRDGHS
jgi:hypothetical protein